MDFFLFLFLAVGYGGSLDGTWPYSYDECDVGTLPNQTNPLTGLPEIAKTSCVFPLARSLLFVCHLRQRLTRVFSPSLLILSVVQMLASTTSSLTFLANVFLDARARSSSFFSRLYLRFLLFQALTNPPRSIFLSLATRLTLDPNTLMELGSDGLLRR
jgi:hypothetical protein